MCGLTGYIDLQNRGRVENCILEKMTAALHHRGPDSTAFYTTRNLGFGFRRLAIIDRETGDQPLLNEDGSLVLMCNGEIYNYSHLREDLIRRGHRFRSRTDVEVLLHLYEEKGPDFLNDLNGQFAFAIYDCRRHTLFLARDQFGICPLFYTVVEGLLIFGSEIKAILEHTLVPRSLDLTTLDQVLSLPGPISPRTMFKDVHSLPAGHYLIAEAGEIKICEYWDLQYPGMLDSCDQQPAWFYQQRLRELLEQSVKYRLQADVLVGFFLSGGLDSSLIAAMVKKVSPDSERHSFSVNFSDQAICEARYQALMAEHVGTVHHSIRLSDDELAARLRDVVFHAECPLKESYNAASYALSACTRQQGVTVVLNGEGSDELFAGYVGYRFDALRRTGPEGHDLDRALGDEIREKLWGDPELRYERDEFSSREMRLSLYSDGLAERFDEFDCSNSPLINKRRLQGLHPVHKRSYLDFKLRLAGHLIADHGDRMAMANSIEARYPFLDPEVVQLCRWIPPELKLNGFTEKQILKDVAKALVPEEIVAREKFAFVAPGSPSLLRQNLAWVNDLLSYERIRRQGHFNPDAVEFLKKRYSQDGFRLDPALEDDWLMIVLTFSLFQDLFSIPDMN